jgi:hypothetical protein
MVAVRLELVVGVLPVRPALPESPVQLFPCQRLGVGPKRLFVSRLDTTGRTKIEVGWLVRRHLVLMAVLHLEGVEMEDHLEAILLDPDRAEAYRS